MAKSVTQLNNESFLQKYYHYIIILLMVILVLLMAAVGFVLYEVKNRPVPLFFARTTSGEQMQLTHFEEPNLLPSTLIRWASKGAVAAYTFTFSNYRNQIQAARPYFTESGFRDYLASASNLISILVANQLFVNSIVSGTAVISNQGPLPGRGYTWRIQIPLLVTYISANTYTKKNFLAILTIVRVPTVQNPQGIGIDQFVMVPYAG